MLRGALLDTSFLIRLLLPSEGLHAQATAYYKYFLEQQVPLFISTISVAEYCVQGSLGELPLQQVQIAPFNLKDAEHAGRLMRLLLQYRSTLQSPGRKVVMNDVKLYAQADVHTNIDAFVTSDSEGKKCMRRFMRNRRCTLAILIFIHLIQKPLEYCYEY